MLINVWLNFVCSHLNYKVRDVLKQTALHIVTGAVDSISIKSIFARAVIGSQGVVTNSINITAVCSVGTLVKIYNNKRNLTEKNLIQIV